MIIEIQDAEVQAMLQHLLTALDDLTPALDAIGQEMESRVSARFETESDPLGTPWAPWTPSTVKTYPRDGNRRILDRYGDMLRSLNHQVESNSVLVGFGQGYARYHETGTRKMKRRGLLLADPDAGTLAPDDQEAIMAVLEDFFTQD